MKIVRESKYEFRIPPPKMKIVRESKSEFRIPPAPKMEIVRESKSEFRIPPQMKIVRVQVRVQNTSQNENCQRVQV